MIDQVNRKLSKMPGWHRVERKLVRGFRRKSVALRNEHGVVSFTFDDVPQSACREGRRILEDHDALGTFYVAGGLEGQVLLSGPIHTRVDLEALVEAGHEIGSHGYSHANYQDLSAEGIEKDIEDNNLYFTKLGFDVPPVNFAYPFGNVGFVAKSICSRHFTTARGVWTGVNIGVADLLQLKSMPLYNSAMVETDIDKLFEIAAQRKAWLIFVSHGVVDDPDPYSCSKRLLIYALDRALNVGLEILTVRNAIGRIAFASADARGIG